MICVECGNSVTDLYRQFSKGNIRLTHCGNCSKLADKYVEYDPVIIFLDLVLLRVQVYRHILFNQIEYCDKGISRTFIKIFLVYLFFESYTKWIYLKYENESDELRFSFELAVILGLSCCIEFLLFVFTIIMAVKLSFVNSESGNTYALIKYNYLVMAIILSSFGKVFVFLMIIWNYDHYWINFFLIELFVFTSNVLAVRVFLNSSIKGVTFVTIAFIVKLAFRILTQYWLWTSALNWTGAKIHWL